MAAFRLQLVESSIAVALLNGSQGIAPNAVPVPNSLVLQNHPVTFTLMTRTRWKVVATRTLSPEAYRATVARAESLGLTTAEYLRHAIARELESSDGREDSSVLGATDTKPLLSAVQHR